MDDKYSTERRLLIELHGQIGSWDGVAQSLGNSRALWWMIAHSKRDPTWEQRNEVRRYFGMDLIPYPAIDTVIESGIEYAIKTCDNPDTAILVDVNARNVEQVRITVGEGTVTESDAVARVRPKRKPRTRKRSTISVDWDLKQQLDAIKGDRTWNDLFAAYVEEQTSK